MAWPKTKQNRIQGKIDAIQRDMPALRRDIKGMTQVAKALFTPIGLRGPSVSVLLVSAEGSAVCVVHGNVLLSVFHFFECSFHHNGFAIHQ